MTKLNALAVRASSTPFLREEKPIKPLISLVKNDVGAGDGNRTHVTSLEGWSSTIELHPHRGGANSSCESSVVNDRRGLCLRATQAGGRELLAGRKKAWQLPGGGAGWWTTVRDNRKALMKAIHCALPFGRMWLARPSEYERILAFGDKERIRKAASVLLAINIPNNKAAWQEE